jgi:hypothetical protein
MSIDAVAWIVAIENYADPGLNLGATVGRWAIDFAKIMLDGGVEKVVLSASLTDGAYRQQLEALGGRVVLTGAAQAQIQNAFAELRGKRALLFYWAGHGIMAPARELLCADSSKNDLRSVTAESILKRLRSTGYGYPPLQLGFFECCAQVVTADPSALTLGGDGGAQARQFFYYAASAADVASASTDRPGFSTTVLDALRAARPLPPDPPSFFQVMETALAALPLDTRPFWTERTRESGDQWFGPGGDDADRTANAASVAEMSRPCFERLLRTLKRTNATAADLALALRNSNVATFAAGLSSQDQLAPAALEKARTQVGIEREFEPFCLRLRLSWQDWSDLNARAATIEMGGKPQPADSLTRLLLNALDREETPKGQQAFIRILELAARRARRGRAGDEMADALTKALGAHPVLGAAYADAVSDLPAEKERLYLLLALDWDPNDNMASLVNAWVFPGTHSDFDSRSVPAAGTLAEKINKVIQQTIREYRGRTMVVELMSPNELLSMPRELLEVNFPGIAKPRWLEARHAITLRWHDRMKGGYDLQEFEERARAARTAAASAAALCCAWRPPDAQAAANAHFLGLTFPGPCPKQPTRNISDFLTGLMDGGPYMCWPREDLGDTAAFKKAVRDWFGTIELKDVPNELAARRMDPGLENLLVLIDEPGRNPYEDTLTEAGQRGDE